jgi:hypothetical protein
MAARLFDDAAGGHGPGIVGVCGWAALSLWPVRSLTSSRSQRLSYSV